MKFQLSFSSAFFSFSQKLFHRSEKLTTLPQQDQKPDQINEFKFLADSIPQIVWTAGPDGNLDYYNKHWFEYTGMTLEQTKDWGWKPVLHPDDLQTCIDTWTESFTTGKPYEVEYRFKQAKDGIYKWHLGRAVPMKNEKGEIVKWFGSCTDIDEYKRALDLQKLKTATSQSNIGFWEWDLVNNTLEWDETSYKLFGKTINDLINPADIIETCILPEDLQKVNECIAETISSKQNMELNYRVAWSDNSIHHLISKAIVQVDDSGTPLRLVGTNTDITAIKEAEEQLKKSERNLNAILFSSQEGLYMLDKAYNVVLINEATHAAIKNIAIKECRQGENFLECFDKKIQTELLEIFAKVLQGRHVESERIVEKDGEKLYYSTTYFPVLDENGAILNICCSFKNITEKRKTEETIKAANTEKEEFQYRFQSILDNYPQGVTIKDLDLRITFINRKFLEFFSIERRELIDTMGKDIFKEPETIRNIRKADFTVKTEKRNVEWEERLTMPCGEVKDVRISKFPIYDRNQALCAIGCFYQDITDIKKYQHDLVIAREKAEQAEMLQEQFLANMSHELRTPMNGIIGMANVLSNSSMDAEQQRKLQVIIQSSGTLLNLVNDILDLSKIKAGMLNIEKTAFDFNEIIADTASAFKERALAKGIRFFVQTDPFIPKTVAGDQLRLVQILNNLLSNAIKFTEKGFVKLEAYLKDKTDHQAVIEFIVTDSGIGIEQDNLESIFNSFSQASEDIARKYGGTGLGLPITRRLIELQGGEMTVESNFGKGSVFTFCITYDIAKNIAASAEKPVYTSQQASTKKNYAGKHALIVEDNEINQDVLVATLKQFNITSELANNGKEAIELLEGNQKFDIIFMDLRMPVMNGFQTTAYIREKLHLQIPIVVLTASVLRNERERCLGLGANDYMSKPFNPVHLNLCLHRFFGNPEPEIKNGEKSIIINSSASSGYKSYCINNLLELEDEESIRHVLQLFTEKIPQQMNDLKNAILQNNRQGFLEMAHKMKGSLSVIQIASVSSLLEKAESIAKLENEMECILPILQKALAIYNNLIAEIGNEVEKNICVI